ncbi:MAG: hypothetical protein AAGC60_02785 [Acidobacteriota bacterium]
MPDFLLHLSPVDWLQLGLGLVLLVVGRRLYWLAVAGLGFAVGFYLADQLFTSSVEMRLLVGVAAGVAGGFLALAAQRLAVGAAGFVLGAWGLAVLVQRFGADLGLVQVELWMLPAAAFGGFLGLVFSSRVFDAVLLLAAALAGATLVVSPLELTPPWPTWIWLGLVVASLAVQAGTRRRKAKLDD